MKSFIHLANSFGCALFLILALASSWGSERGRPDFQQPEQDKEESFLSDGKLVSKYLDEHTTVVETRVGDCLVGQNKGEKETILTSPENGTVNRSELSCPLPIDVTSPWKITYSARSKLMTYTFGGNTVSVRVTHPVSEIFVRARGAGNGIYVAPTSFKDSYRGRSTFSNDLNGGDPKTLNLENVIQMFVPGVQIIRITLEHITDEFELEEFAKMRNASPPPERSQLAFQIKLNCNTPALDPLPTSGSLAYDQWNSDYEVSASEGTIISNVTQHGRPLATGEDGIRMPFGLLKTAQRSVPTRFNLVPNGATGDFEWCLLVKFKDTTIGNARVLRATYQLHSDHECIRITQWYHFEREYNPYIDPTKVAYPNYLAGVPHPPFITADLYPTAKLAPIVYYEYYSSNDDTVEQLTLPIEVRWSQNTDDSLFDLVSDPNTLFSTVGGVISLAIGTVFFTDSPGYPIEHMEPIIVNGQRGQGNWDNYHYTSDESSLDIPWFNPPGCAECVHMHWRWGDFMNWPNGNLLIPKASNQTVRLFALTQNHALPDNLLVEVNGEAVGGVAQSMIYEGNGKKPFDNVLIHGIAYNGSGELAQPPQGNN